MMTSVEDSVSLQTTTIQLFNYSTIQQFPLLFNYSTYISELTVITEESVEKVLFLESDIDNDILMQQRPCVIFSDFPR